MNIFTTLLIEPLANGLIVFYRILGSNMGFAIIGFTIFLRIILNPLTKPYMESMKKIKDIAPDIEKLKQKYKGDKMKFAQAQADFYKEKGINPGAGCLPYLFQIIILIAFFNVFTRTISGPGDPVSDFNSLLYDSLKFKEGEHINMNFLYFNLTEPDVFKNPALPFSLPGPILLLSSIVQVLSAKVMIPFTKTEEKIAKKTKEASDDMQVAMQKSMTYTFPFFTLIIGMQFASGLALYWLVFSIMQIYQQVRMQGWGELTPLINRFKLVK